MSHTEIIKSWPLIYSLSMAHLGATWSSPLPDIKEATSIGLGGGSIECQNNNGNDSRSRSKKNEILAESRN